MMSIAAGKHELRNGGTFAVRPQKRLPRETSVRRLPACSLGIIPAGEQIVDDKKRACLLHRKLVKGVKSALSTHNGLYLNPAITWLF